MPPNLDQIRERAQAWGQPIAPEAPTGSSAKSLPGYEGVVQEITKLQSPAEAASVDWQRIVDSGRDILQKRSKDLPIAVYVTLGLYSTSGLAGLLEGTLVLGDMLERYWGTLFPEVARTRARVNALQWYVERATAVLSGNTRYPEGELFAPLQQAVERVSQLSREKLANDSPGFGPLLKVIEQHALSNQPMAPSVAPTAPSAPAGTPSTSPPPAVAGPAAPAPPAEGADVGQYLRQMGTALATTAAQMRRADPSNAAAYRLLREGLWMHLEVAPPAAPDGKTTLPPLPEAKRNQLQALEANAKWLELLEESESLLATNRFNLDLQATTARALEALGPTHQGARDALITALAAWIRRVPATVDLLAQDGSPMAGAETKKWIAREVKGQPAAPAGEAAPSGDQAPDEDQQVLAAARALVGKKKYLDAVRLVQARMEASPTGRAKFMLGLSIAKLCADGGQTGAAKALYQALDEASLEHRLDTWDPALASACLEGLLRCARGDRGPLPPEYNSHFQRLCRLSPSVALSANGLLATR